jgi:predicted ATPase
VVTVARPVDIDPGGGLAGRSAEVDQLRSAVRRVAGGTGGALVVVGEAGIGKTRVVAAGLADADELGVRVFEGAADELEQRRPFGVIADAWPLAARPPRGGEQRLPSCSRRARAPAWVGVG